MTFNKYLETEICKSNDPQHYDPSGNSARAIAQRGLFKEIVKQYSYLPGRGKSLLREYDGFNTPVGLVIAVPFFLLFFPVIPVFLGAISHRLAIKEYRAFYARFYKIHT